MKRPWSETIDEMASITMKINGLQQKRANLNATLLERELAESKVEMQRFIHDAHITSLRNNRSEDEYFNPPESRVATATTLRHVFNVGELSLLILRHLGPCELAMLVRVARDFRPLVTTAFPILAESLLFDYVVGSAPYISDTNPRAVGIKDSLSTYTRLVVMYNQLPIERRLPIEVILSLWHHCMLSMRTHGMATRIESDDACFIGYAFAYNPETHRVIRLCDLNLYTIGKQRSVLEDVADRLGQKGCILPADLMPYCRYDDLCKLEMKRVVNVMTPTETYLVENDGITLLTKSGFQLYYCDPLYMASGYARKFGTLAIVSRADGDIRRRVPQGSVKYQPVPTNTDPFFDHYAQRLYMEAGDRIVYPRDLTLHFNTVRSLLS